MICPNSMLYFYLSCTALIIFLIYVITCLCLFGVTTSLSDTYYKFEDKKKGLGKILFYSVLAIVALLTIISVIDKVGIFALLMAVGILLVAVFPEFNDNTQMDLILHPIGAGIAAITSIVVLFMLLPVKCAFILLGLVTSVVLLFALSTNTLKSCYVYHIEMIAFYTLFGSTIFYNLLFR